MNTLTSYHYCIQSSLVDSCDTNNGWADVENKCYRHFDQQLSWEAARTSCRQLNGDLIVITSGTVVNILQDTFVNITTSFWIGLRDQNGANNLADYRWTDGTSLTSYTNWASGQPSNTNQRCVTADPQWSWFDESCTQLASYMCQKSKY
ncbi:uncharacterized protein TRIADDRAFT_33913 [Trichoplax adhaerens]|uniref:C-type lectin domain-containing protein n=1 Tax=Trichoplax adhaerens TaxID=10228 RepID=B3SDG2_TRIAD|nr:hypothetical protein TRIADDRAFT_33913 [Trichoplax adhaerens]EDV19226.1 hypothetical protein TRIADDRAFT_33913 [Trichoplax adhaerens]|eukprot:XP_002118292.1 hypothetical protein TRIADDRAFT_33913 [Trichoplax adhaerens]